MLSDRKEAHTNPGDRLTHSTGYDSEYGIRSRCNIRGRGIGWEDPAGPVNCPDCRTTALIDGVDDAMRCRRVDRLPRPTLLVVEAALYVVVVRSQTYARLCGTGSVPPLGHRLFGVPMQDTAELPAGRWRLVDVAAEGTV